jgi:hypothetical protein
MADEARVEDGARAAKEEVASNPRRPRIDLMLAIR